MTTHVRQQIREAVATLVTGLTTTGANVFQMRTRPLTDANLPALMITTNDEQVVNNITVGFPNRQERTLTVSVVALVKAAASANPDDTVDTIIKEVEAALGASTSTYTLSGLARGGITLDSIRIDMDDETDKPVMRATMDWQAVYYTLSNAPDTAV